MSSVDRVGGFVNKPAKALLHSASGVIPTSILVRYDLTRKGRVQRMSFTVVHIGHSGGTSRLKSGSLPEQRSQVSPTMEDLLVDTIESARESGKAVVVQTRSLRDAAGLAAVLEEKEIEHTKLDQESTFSRVEAGQPGEVTLGSVGQIGCETVQDKWGLESNRTRNPDWNKNIDGEEMTLILLHDMSSGGRSQEQMLGRAGRSLMPAEGFLSGNLP